MIVDTVNIDMTEIVEAVAKGIVDRRAELSTSEHPPNWDSLSPMGKTHVRETVLPIVSLTLAAIEAQTLARVESQVDVQATINRILGTNG